MKLRWQLCLTLFLFSCATARHANHLSEKSHLKFIGEYDLPHNLSFGNTTVGGLSGIDYDPKKNQYYLISDDRSSINPARFYKAQISISDSGIRSVNFTDVFYLRRPNGTVYPNAKEDPAHTPDPEAIRFNPRTNECVWSSEGERIIKNDVTILEDPSIIAMTTEGEYLDSFALSSNTRMHASESGTRQNGVFEGLSFSRDYHSLYVSVEEPLFEDGPRAGIGDSSGWIRIIKYDVDLKKPVAQYAYKIEPVAYPPEPAGAFRINGVPDILEVADNKLLVIERSFSTGRKPCTIRVFLADLSVASDIRGIRSLRRENNWTPAAKKLILDMDTLGIYTDNIEGVCFGPRLTNGHATLLFIADNNFDKAEISQLLLFEIQ